MIDRSGPPRRWRDDPQTLERLGLDLDAERASLTPHDLEALKGGLETQIAAGVGGGAGISAGWWWLVGVAGIVAAGAGLSGLVDGAGEEVRPDYPRTAQARTSPPPAADRTTLPPAAHNQQAPARSLSSREALAAARTEPALVEPQTARVPAVPRQDVVPNVDPVRPSNPEPARASPEANVSADADAERPTAPTASDLAAQLERYEAGQGALRGGAAAEAIAIFERYVSDFPHGRLRVEAELGLLEARVTTRDYAGAEALARRLAEDPLASHRRREILRVLGESRVLLGRCAEARVAFEAAEVSTAFAERALARCSEGEAAEP